MAVLLNIGELGGVNASVTKVNQESQNSSSMNNILGDFKTASAGNELKGKIWNSEGQKIQVFMDAMKKSQNIADRLAETISKAVNALMGAWDSRFGESIDDAYRDQIERELRAAEAELASLEAQKLDTSSARALVAELRSLLNAIDNFLAVFATEMSNLNSVESEVEGDFGSFVAGITATAPWNFNPTGMEAVQNGLDNIDEQLLDKDAALETDSLSTGLTASTNVQEPEYYSDRYISDGSNGRPKNSGTTVNYTVIPKDTPPQYYLSLNDKGTVTRIDPSKMVDELDTPEIFVNCGFNDGIHISNGQVYTDTFTPDKPNRAVTYMDSSGNLGSFDNKEIMTNGKLDEDKLQQKIEENDIVYAYPSFGAMYVAEGNEDGSDFIKTSGFDATHEDSRRPRAGIAQFEDGDYLLIEVDGDKNEHNYNGSDSSGMTMQEFYDYVMNDVQEQVGKKIIFFNQNDGGSSSTYIVNGESIDKITEHNTSAERPRSDGLYIQ